MVVSDGLTLLAGIECDILANGRLDLADDCLAQLDIVIASVHSHFSQDEAHMTERIVAALECPWVDVLGHPTGRRLLKRDPFKIDFDAVTATAASGGNRAGINCQVDRLDLSDAQAWRRRELPIVKRFRLERWRRVVAVGSAGGAAHGLPPDAVLNSRALDLRPLLRRNRRR